MKTDLETMIGYLAGREGSDTARLRGELDDPSSEASRFLEAARRKTRALIAERPADEPRPSRRAGRTTSRRLAPALVVALLLVSALVPIRIAQVRERKLRADLERAEAESRVQAGRLEAAIAHPPSPRPSATVPARPRDEPIALALNRVEAGLGKLERRLDGLARPTPAPSLVDAPSPPPTAPAPAPDSDAALAEIRTEIAAIRRETAASEQATARQLQEMRTVIQELNKIIRQAIGGPRGGVQGPVPLMMPDLGPSLQGIDPSQLQALVQSLTSPHPQIRLEAAEQLSRLGPAARPAAQNLRQMLHHDPDGRVRNAAQAALSRLGQE